MQTDSYPNPDLQIWCTPLNNQRPYHRNPDAYLPTPPSSSDSSSSDSDSSSIPSSPDTPTNELDVPSSPPPPYPGLSPPSSPDMTASLRLRHVRPKPTLSCAPFPCYDPRAPSSSSSSCSPFSVSFTPFPPTSPISPTTLRRRLHSISESPMESLGSLPAEDQDVGDVNIGDDEYDCGYAMDLGAESPSPSIGSLSGTPGLGSRSSSSLLSSTSSISPSSSISNQDARLAESITRRPGGAGAIYKRELEGQEEVDERLAREWAVAAGIASVAVEPSSALVGGKRSRGASVSAAYPPVTGSRQVSRRNSRSTAQWDEADRDCGICFEYAVRPARTVCCGKLFCQEHLEDWLSGPNASGLCPNCDTECSLEKDVISLAAPKLTNQKSTRSSTGGRVLSAAAAGTTTMTSTRRVSSSNVGLEPSSVVSRSSSSQPLLSPPLSPAYTPPSPIPTFSTSRASPTSASPPTTMYLNVPYHQQASLLSPPPLSRSASLKGLSPGQLSPRSLLTTQQQYERLLAQEHRPSSPLSTNLPIVNPFDSTIGGDVLGGVEALGSRRGVKGEFGRPDMRVEIPSSGSIVELVEDGETDSEKGYGPKDMGMWNGLEKGKKSVKEVELDPAHAVKHAASLVGCLVVLYLVVR